ncbi:P protein [avian paramyxovirus 11]|uniref:Phosphoprotein n=1 Tax=avian paramyxovirus 11 TaxID=2560310 RepID=I6UTP6_9MONO|nr:P protein [Avian paramyxovirus 11]AFN06861.1 P protein [Avian paramyxovirus 11]
MRAKGIGSRDPPRHWHFIMDFTNDEEISDLLNQSERVITEIQRASQQPKSTVGKSAIPRGNTSNLTQAWESESSSTAEMGPISSLSTAKNANSEPTLKSGTAQPEGHQSQNPSSLPHIDDTITKEQPIDESVIKSQIKEGAIGTQLDRFLDKTASRMKAESGVLRRGSISTQRNQEKSRSNLTPMPAMTPTTPGHQEVQPVSNTVHQSGLSINTTQSLNHSPELEEWGIGENISSAVKGTNILLNPGATQNVHPSGQTQLENNAGVVTAPEHVPCVTPDHDLLLTILQKLDKIEERLSDVMKLTAQIPGIKNDVMQLKATTGLLSTQMASIMVLDPGHASISSLSEMKRQIQPRVVVQTGIGDPSPYVSDQGVARLDELARPMRDPQSNTTSKEPEARIVDHDKEAVRALIDTVGLPDNKRDRFIKLLEKTTTKEGLKRLKTQIMNS